MPEFLRYAIDLVQKQFFAVLHTDFARVEFSNLRWAIGAAILLILAILLKFLWSVYAKKKVRRQSSGHPVVRRHDVRPLWKRLAYGVPRILCTLASVFLLIALARPYVTNSYDVSKIKSTEICYLEDASSSMADRFGGLEKSKAEVSREALLEFLKLRKGKHDRSCFWLFSSNPYKIEDFTNDERSFVLQVYYAPWVFSFGSYQYIPFERLIYRSGEGGTDMDDALQAQAKYFNSEGVPEIKGAKNQAPRRVLVIITDAEVDRYPEQGFRDLADARIVPYLIYFSSVSVPDYDEDEGYSAPPSRLSQVAQRFVDAIREHGGKSFFIAVGKNTPSALADAFAEIDRIEKVENEVRHYSERIEIFQLPLAIGIALLILAAFFGSIMELFGRNP